MMIEFNIASEGIETICFFSKNFPEINLQIGDSIFPSDFREFLEIGRIYCPEDCEKFGGFDELSGLHLITDILHCKNKLGYIKIIYLKLA